MKNSFLLILFTLLTFNLLAVDFLSDSLDVRSSGLQIEEVELKRGTFITLKLTKEIRSQDIEVGGNVEFEVYLDLIQENHRVVRAGTTAFGKIAAVRRCGMFGRGAYIEIEGGMIQTIDGQAIFLKEAKLKRRGKSRSSLAWGLSLALPAAAVIAQTPIGIGLVIVGFFIKGKPATIHIGERVIGQVKKDVTIKYVKG